MSRRFGPRVLNGPWCAPIWVLSLGAFAGSNGSPAPESSARPVRPNQPAFSVLGPKGRRPRRGEPWRHGGA
eukprot:9393127-Pyramimonas_sp.AAC.1